MITVEKVNEALSALEKGLDLDDDFEKASEQDLDQPEGSDFEGKNTNMKGKKKMSDDAPGPDKSKKAAKSFSEEDDLERSFKKKTKKAIEADEQTEEEDEDTEEDDMEMSKKSFAEDLPEEIQTKIDVSDFLKSLVDHTGETIDSLRGYIAKSDVAQETRYDELNESVEDIQKSQAKIGVVLKAICERIGVIETSPAAPRANGIAKSEVATREFNDASQEGQPEKVFKSLSENPQIAKSQISESLCDLVRKGEATDLDVIGFESGGYIRPELVTKLKTVMN
jgi:hypothetical protein